MGEEILLKLKNNRTETLQKYQSSTSQNNSTGHLNDVDRTFLDTGSALLGSKEIIVIEITANYRVRLTNGSFKYTLPKENTH